MRANSREAGARRIDGLQGDGDHRHERAVIPRRTSVVLRRPQAEGRLRSTKGLTSTEESAASNRSLEVRQSPTRNAHLRATRFEYTTHLPSTNPPTSV